MEGEWLCSVSNKDVHSTEKCIKKYACIICDSFQLRVNI